MRTLLVEAPGNTPTQGAFPFTTLPGLFRYAVARFRGEDALSWPLDGGWVSWSHGELERRVKRLALGLHDLGIRKGESVGLIAPSFPLWIVVDLAIQAAGAVTVPIFKRISEESFLHEVKDSGMRFLFVGNPEEMPMAHRLASGLVELVSFWYSGRHERFDALAGRGEEIDRADPRLFDRLSADVAETDLATIIYTSGSTGLPKGVELTQGNLVSQVRDAAARFRIDPGSDRCLSALPLEHVFERMVMYFYFASGVPVSFVDDPKRLAEYAAFVRPTVMTVVPRILEKVADKISEGSRSAKGARGMLARAAVRRAGRRGIDARSANPMDALYSKVVYPHMTAALGGRLRMVISGSARLEPEVARLLINVGIPIYEGYGLTEAAPVIAVNYPGARRLGTVGPLFPSVQVRISEDGEILARGPNIMRGYHNLPNASAQAFTADGWLRTGDLGELDDHGYLLINGRKKEMFKKSTGEYVPPGPIEHALSRIPFVDTAMIVADNRTYVTALLFPDPQKLPAYKAGFGLSGMSDAEFLKSGFLRGETQRHVDEINAHLHHCERVERFAILDHAPSVETGELTPTLKARR
ncbi:MAG: AMP-dependent synthetase/ligase, partial [Spirochaetia bacterium]